MRNHDIIDFNNSHRNVSVLMWAEYESSLLLLSGYLAPCILLFDFIWIIIQLRTDLSIDILPLT